MSFILEDKDRRVVPRWRDYRTTAQAGELDAPLPDRPLITSSQEFFTEKLDAWESHKSVETAADLVSAALVLGRRESALEAARSLVSDDSRATSIVKLLARRLLNQPGDRAHSLEDATVGARVEEPITRQRINELRRQLAEEPRNSLAWVDLSRTYVILGQDQQAVRAMSIALRLTPTNRFVLRSASRLFVHLGDPDRAHELLRRNESTREDPWLLSAEIAIASVAGRKSRLIRKGQRIVSESTRTLFQIAELASALGTLELGDGDLRKARKLFRTSLVEPTDNTVAQAGWAGRRISGIELDARALRTPRSFEARAWEAFVRGGWQDVVDNCERWQIDEPFSSRPAIMGSYVAAALIKDFALGERFALRGLRANPDDQILLNNLVVALADLGRLEEAKEIFDKIPKPGREVSSEITLLATEGLLRFRSGDAVSGRSLYLRAIEIANAKDLRRVRALAALHLLKEEVRAQSGEIGAAHRLAVAASKNIRDADVLTLLAEFENLKLNPK